MTQPQIELKACPNPSCNSDNIDLMSISMGECNWTVGCNECAMTGPQTFTTVQATAGWNLLPRSSPQVAPGLQEAIKQAILNDKVKQWIYAEHLDRIAEIAADIAAAQGGTVVDRNAAVCPQCGYDASKWVTFGRIKVDIENETETFERCTDTDSAVPSAPGGTERVTAVQDAFADLQLECGDAIEKVDGYAYDRLREAIDALGQPQGADSLSYTAELPVSISEAGDYYWIESQPGKIWPLPKTGIEVHLAMIWIEPIAGTGTLMFRYCDGTERDVPHKLRQIYLDEGMRLAGPIQDMRPKSPMHSLPAQPVAAGEAKERGDNE